jgi:hypothetical protein
MGGTQGVQKQSGFRGREDTVDESDDTTWFAPLNTSWVAPALDTNFRVRFEITLVSLSSDFDSGQYELFYSHNSGSFTRTTSVSSVIKSVLSGVPGYDHGDDATQLIGSGTFKVDNDQICAKSFHTVGFRWLTADGAPQYVETEWVLQLVSADLSNGDTVELRVRRAAGVFGGGYDYFPIITMQDPQIEIKGGEFKIDGKELVIK